MAATEDSTVALLRRLTEMRRAHPGIFAPEDVQVAAQEALNAYFREGGMTDARPADDVIIAAALETLREWAFAPLFQLVRERDSKLSRRCCILAEVYRVGLPAASHKICFVFGYSLTFAVLRPRRRQGRRGPCDDEPNFCRSGDSCGHHDAA